MELHLVPQQLLDSDGGRDSEDVLLTCLRHLEQALKGTVDEVGRRGYEHSLDIWARRHLELIQSLPVDVELLVGEWREFVVLVNF